MRYLIILLLVTGVIQASFAQILQDDFSDGNFTTNPVWTGTTADFIVNGANELQTDNLGVSATSELSTAAAIQDSTFWEFYVRMGFNPSTSNYTRVYLQADNATLSNTANGYYLQIGASGSTDSIEIYRVDAGVSTKIFGGTNAAVANNPVLSMRIIRNQLGGWEVFADYTGGTTYLSEGTFTDATYTTGTHFGFLATYTTTRGDKFFFDNVYLSPLMVDVTAPSIDSIVAIGANQVDVYFDEVVELASANTSSNYSINNGVTVTNAVRDASNLMLVHLTTSTLTSALTNTITINGVEDLNNNSITNGTGNFVYYNIQSAAFQDIIINEIHADPSPVVGLPNGEFVELLNRSNKIIDLGGMFFNDGSDKALPSFLLFPDSIVVLTATANVGAYAAYGNVLDIGGLTMTNGGELIRLKSAGGQTLDSVDYDLSWYQDGNKDDGGWTLELINPNLICQGANNWIASNDAAGGTPGQQNSVYNNTPDTQGPNLLSANFLNSTTVQLIFDEQLDPITANTLGNYTIAGLSIVGANFMAADTVLLTVSTMTDQTTYTVVVNNVADCSGNPIVANSTANFTYVTIQSAAFQDIIINEIHADPSPVVGLPNGEFVELLNRSNKTIDLGGLILNDGSDHSIPSYILAPDSIVVLTATANVGAYAAYGNVLDIGGLTMTNGGELIRLKSAGGQTLDSVDYDLSWYQDGNKDDGGWTLELINPNLICQGANNWIASNDAAGGTPGQQNSVYSNTPDTQGPSLIAAAFVNATQVLLSFDEPLGSNVSTVANYTLTTATVNTAVFTPPNQVTLTLASPMVDQTNYIVTVNGLTDCSGNSIATNTVDSFVYYEVQMAAYHDLIITEIHADPSPVVGLPDAEFIELYNRSNKTIDLANYTLFESSNHSLPSQIVLPGTYVILCAASNQASFATYGTVVPMNSLSLTNGGELLMLLNSNGLTVDSLVYDEDWYQDNAKDNGGWSLELINPNLLCKGASNWVASNAVNGGTPGQQNSVYTNAVDNTPPAVVSTRQYGSNQILIEFDDVLNKTIAGSAANYTVDNGAVVITVVCLSDHQVILTLGANMVDQTVYTITLNNLEDCVGNSMGIGTTSMTYYESGAATHYDIIINEIMADPNPPVGLPEKEYVELYNRSNKTFNLEHFTFTDASSVVSTLPFFILHPGEYVVIYSAADTIGFSSFGHALALSSFPDLNTSDELILQDQSGEIIDAVAYELSWYQNADKDNGGWSIERINPDRPCEAASNWRASENLLGGTPAAANSVLNQTPDVQSPDALRAFPLGVDSVRVYFSEAIADLAGVTVANYTIDNNIQVVTARLEPPFYNSVVLTLDQPLILGTTYTITMGVGLTDCIGNPIALKNTARLALPQDIQPGDLILNEVLFNPVTSGKDFIELYNKSNKVLNTADLVVSNAEIVDGNLANATSLQTRPIEIDWLVFPNEYVVITADEDQVKGQYQTPNPTHFVENNLPTFDDKEGHVFLYAAYDSTYVDSLGNPQTAYLAKVLDLFDYSEDFHSPLIDDKNGVSLERIDFDAPTNDLNNWHSAATEVGYATPAYQNSSYLTNDILGNDLIELPTETVSPDGDGYEDFLLINYNVDDLGYIATIDVYDATGRLVRNLVNGELLAREGALQWDGTDNQGRKARVGIHLLAIEIFRPDGTVRRFKKTCVVAGRMD
ncbi:lamin tail domain-containing protein [Aureispira anguillae]|uniref:Lamin tail domain-containing protein n=1 Tax=Aureispira anguillae TaxID=2864201 RepID=A0A915YL19_9BACT|nr:lamin tail domain-containing protein [Aureispira anguillae]BDS14733.1 lamin tail domain-containing protein [Aureispira anguillae]